MAQRTDRHDTDLLVAEPPPVTDRVRAAPPPAMGRTRSPRRLARVAGLLYLTIFVCGLFAELGVRGTLIEWGDGVATIENLLGSPGLFRAGLLADVVMVAADVAIAVVVLRLLAPVDDLVAKVAAAFRMAQAAVLGAGLVAQVMAIQLLDGDGLLAGFTPTQRGSLVLQSLEFHRFAYFVALVFFGIHLLLLAWLIVRSTFLPRALGWLLAAGGVGYLVDSTTFFTVAGYEGTLSGVVLAPALVAELAMVLWLLVRGVDARRWHEVAGEVAR